MSYIGNNTTFQTVAPGIDYFSGNASTTTFQLSRQIVAVQDILVYIDNVPQNPSTAYSINTATNQITFTSAPLSGTNNIWVYYNTKQIQFLVPSPGTVSNSSLNAGTFSNITGVGTLGSLTVSGLTATQLLYAGTGGLLNSSANMTFNGTSLTLANDASISGLTVGKGAGALDNTVVGRAALANGSQSGTNISAFGVGALNANTSGSSNTAIGQSALQNNTTASNNTGVGYNAGFNNTTGASNTAIGVQALNANTTASNNTAVGYQALISNTTASNNTAVGYQSLYAQSGSAGPNDAFGKQSGYSTTTGYYNASFGNASLYSTTTGAQNTAIGPFALYSNTTANNNTAVGYQAGYSNTQANQTFVGYQSGYSTTTGDSNVGLGYQTLYSNTTGVNNTAIGYRAGYGLTTGSSNVFLGSRSVTNGNISGYSVTTGGANVIVGNYPGGGAPISATGSNYIVLSDGDGNVRAYWQGNGTLTTTTTGADYSIYAQNSNASTPYGMIISFTGASPNNTTQQFLACGDSTNYKLYIYSNGTVSNRTGTYNTISDAKLKENIIDTAPKLDDLMKVKVRNYNLIGDNLKQIGFVAQELETIFPALIDNVPDLDENKQPTGEVTKGVKLTVMIPILVKAIQELKADNDSMRAALKAAGIAGF